MSEPPPNGGPARFREVIPPVAPGGPRPLWSVMIPTYNCGAFLRETLSSVLSQAPSPDLMQIEVVDDHSTKDDPESITREVGQGRVGFYRQPENVGHTRNFDTCIRRASGRLIHILHGDDRVLPGFYRSMQTPFDRDPEIGAAFCRSHVIDSAGNPRYEVPPLQAQSGRIDPAQRVMVVDQPVETPSIVVRREVYEALGGFDRRLRYCGEDLEMWARIAAHYPIWYEVDALAVYRTHTKSLSGISFRSGQNIRDVRLAIDLVRTDLPPGEADEIVSQARERIALWAIAIASDAVAGGDLRVASVQLREAVASSRAPQVLRGARDVVRYALWRKTRAMVKRIRKLPFRWRATASRADRN